MPKTEFKLLVAVVGAKEAKQMMDDFARSVKNAGKDALFTSKGMSRMRNATAGLRRAIGKIRNTFLLAAFATAGFRKAMKSTTEAYIAQIEAEQLLTAGLIRQSKSTEVNSEKLIEYAAALQKVTKFGDEQILAQMAMLTQFGFNEDAIGHVIPAILDLSVGQTNLETATRAVGQAFRGNVGQLTRLGVTIDKFDVAQARAKGKTEEFNFILGKLQETAGGNQRALMQLSTTPLNLMEKRIGDLKEHIGRAMIPLNILWLKGILKLTTGTGTFIMKLRVGAALQKDIAFQTTQTAEELKEARQALQDYTDDLEEGNLKAGDFKFSQAEIALGLQQNMKVFSEMAVLDATTAAAFPEKIKLTDIELRQNANRLQIAALGNAADATALELGIDAVEVKKSSITFLIQENKLKKESIELEFQLSQMKSKAISQALSGFSQLATHNKKTAELARVLAAFEAMVNAHAGAARAMKDYPYPYSLVAAGGAWAAGFARVQAIKAQKFAGGGFVGGSSVGDQVPAMLSSGEFVLSREAVKGIGVEAAEAINRGATTGVTVNINAPLVDDTVVDHIVPAIQRARRRGLV